VLLQDKNAIEKFAEFYFQNSETTVLTQIKKNGQEIDIDLKDAVKVTTEVPYIYSGRFQSSESSKLAIANLEIGDILDFTSIYNDIYTNRISYSDVLSASVPVLFQNLIFDVRNDFDIYRNTFNTTSKFKLTKSKGHNYDGKLDDEMNRFELEVGRLEAQKDEPWTNTYEIEPLVKFMAIPSADKPYHSRKDLGIIKDQLVIDDLVKQFLRDSEINDPYLTSLIGLWQTEIKQLKLTNKNDIANACYYYLRDKLMMLSYAPQNAVNNVKNFGYTYEKIYHGYNNAIDEQFFLGTFSKLLYQFYIDAEVVGVVPNIFGDPSNALTFGEVYFGIYVPSSNSYYWPPDRDKTHLDFPKALLAGGKGKALNLVDVKKDVKGKNIEIAPSKSDDNKDENVLSIKINADNSLAVTQKTSTSGYLKSNFFGLIEQFGDNLYNDFLLMYKDPDIANQLQDYDKQLQKNKKGIYLDFLNKSDANLTENVAKWIEGKGRKTTVDSFEIINSGRTFIKPDHEIELDYKLDGMVKKLGPNLIFDVGMLIESQIQMDEKYKTNRIANIVLGNPRIFKYTIDVTLPEGYYAEGIENLVKSKDNAYLSFVSTAVQEGSQLKITTLKKYKQHFATKENWAAINFHRKRWY
jgi:hypothetical protein